MDFSSIEVMKRGKRERGQSTVEYVAVTAVAVALALGLTYLVLNTALSTALADIGGAIKDFAGGLP